MVQERNSQPRKIQEPDVDRQVDPRHIPPTRYRDSSGSPTTDLVSGLALLLSIISFFLSCYAAIQSGRRETLPTPQSSAQPASRPIFPFFNQAQRIEPGRFLEPTYDRAGEVELISANRELANNLTTVQIRVRRLDQPISGDPTIDLANTIALNSRTNEKYTVTQTYTPNDQFVSLSSLRPGSSVNASVTIRVPQDLDRIDLDIPNVRVFRNVPIG
jgi:hypothetical protein